MVMKHSVRLLAILVGLVFGFALGAVVDGVSGHQAPASAPSATPEKYLPTEVQKLRLQVKHKDAEIAQFGVQVAQQRYQAFLNALQEEGERIKTENHWNLDVQFDANAMTFRDPPAIAPTPAAKPAEDKKP